jgi:GT2 family glycosyltransferase/glycosyltransferase involved in cell wall biosynthesis
VAVADNGSTDDSLAFLEAEYPQVLRLPLGKNHGFAGGYNRALREVSWDLVILLNNDMLVEDDFADHLIAPFRQRDDIFAVSSQIFFQDVGRRREETGRTSARLRAGQLECAHLPVDESAGLVPVFWLGGGSSAVSRPKFVELGGFDELFNPFYLEDMDLSFRAWQQGWPSLLAPRSKVHHRHRGSTGTLDPQTVGRIIARNRLLFVWLNIRDRRLLAQHALWVGKRVVRGRRGGGSTDLGGLRDAAGLAPAVLRRRRTTPRPVVSDREVFDRFAADWPTATQAQPAPGAPSETRIQSEPLARPVPRAMSGSPAQPAPPAPPARDTPAGKRPLSVLFFVPMAVYPIGHGGASRIMNTIWGLSRRGHQTHVVSLVGDKEEQAAMSAIPGVASCRSFIVPGRPEYTPGSMVPTAIRQTYRREMHAHLRQAVLELGADIVQLEYTHSAAYLSADLGAPTVIVEHDLAYRSAFRSALKREGVARIGRSVFDAARLYRWEMAAIAKADTVLTASEIEAEMLRRRGIPHVSGAVPNGVDTKTFEPREARRETRDILFVGYFLHAPNVDGLRYFISEIWPHLRAARPDLTVTVVGGGMQDDLAASAAACGFDCPGFVADVTQELWSHRVFICPIRYGAGTRIKLLESSAAECATVSTTLGAEGLGLRDGIDILLADEPAAFARSVVRLLDDEELRRRLGRSAHDTIERQFDWDNLVVNLEEIYYDLLERT